MTTEAGTERARTQNSGLVTLATIGGGGALVGLSIAAMAIGTAAVGGLARYAIAAGIFLVVGGPAFAGILGIVSRQASGEILQLREALDLTRRQVFESRFANALDMAEGQTEVVEVIERSFAEVLPGADVELLIADEDDARMFRVVGVSSEAEAPGCDVNAADLCPAARRAQMQSFPDSADLDACPKLRQRAGGPYSAVCVPVSVKGHTAGVIHGIGRTEALVDDDRLHDLLTIAKLVGARTALLRLAAPQEVTNDELTGLLNRPAFEQKLADIRAKRGVLTLAMADLDNFSAWNGAHGRESGDKALRLFARVLRDSLRGDDLICRFGGEEFAIAFPACTSVDAQRAIDAIRSRLDAAITVGGLPTFTVSFGVTDAEPQEELAAGLQRADEALLVAKRRGRDRVVLCDSEGRSMPDDNTGNGPIRI